LLEKGSVNSSSPNVIGASRRTFLGLQSTIALHLVIKWLWMCYFLVGEILN